MFEITLIESLAVIYSYKSNVVPLPKDKIALPSGNIFIAEARILSIVNPERIVISGASAK